MTACQRCKRLEEIIEHQRKIIIHLETNLDAEMQLAKQAEKEANSCFERVANDAEYYKEQCEQWEDRFREGYSH